MKAQEIFNYTDYRTFLKDYFKHRKEVQPSFSLGVWSKALGVSSTAVLVNVLNGKRNPGEMISAKFSNYFAFAPKEQQYFQDLIGLSKVQNDPRLSLALMEKMGRANPDGTFRLLDDQTFSAISKWFYYALREMVSLPHFKEDPDWIRDHLEYEVTSKEIKKAIEDLLKLSLLEKDNNGKLKATTRNISMSHDVASEAVKRYHEQVMENGKVSIRKHSLKERDFSSVTINIREENISALKEFLKEFREQVNELFEENAHSSRVFQLNMQLIPLTKCNKQEKKNEN